MDKGQYQHLWEEAEEIVLARDREIEALRSDLECCSASLEVRRNAFSNELKFRQAAEAKVEALREALDDIARYSDTWLRIGEHQAFGDITLRARAALTAPPAQPAPCDDAEFGMSDPVRPK